MNNKVLWKNHTHTHTHTQLLKEKEISRDYHLKRAIIYLIIFTTSPFLVVGDFILFAFILTYWEDKIKDKYGRFTYSTESRESRELRRQKKRTAKITCGTIGIVIGLLITLLPLGLAIYHFYKFWKSYKECQELTNSILTKIDSK